MSNPRYWAERLREQLPLAWDGRARTVWAYEDGAWFEADHLVSDRLPRQAHEVRDIGKLITNTEHYLRSALIGDGATIDPSWPETDYVATPSGLYEILTGRVHESDCGLDTLYRLAVDPVFDADTPVFDRYLSQTFHDGDVVRVLDLLAYSLAPGNPRQEAVMLVGAGGNGKGVLLRLLAAMFREVDVVSVSLQAMAKDSFAARRLYGRAMNIVPEMSKERIGDSTLFKSATGEDVLAMNKKYGEAIDAKVWAHHWFSVNAIPTCSDDSDGWFRRWQVVEFPFKADRSDSTFEERLHRELPAIVGKLLRRLTANRDGSTYRVTETAAGKAAQERLVNRSSPIRAWLSEEAAEITEHLSQTELLDLYTKWAFEEGVDSRFLPTRRAFAESLRSILGPEKQRGGKRGWTPSEARTCF